MNLKDCMWKQYFHTQILLRFTFTFISFNNPSNSKHCMWKQHFHTKSTLSLAFFTFEYCVVCSALLCLLSWLIVNLKDCMWKQYFHTQILLRFTFTFISFNNPSNSKHCMWKQHFHTKSTLLLAFFTFEYCVVCSALLCLLSWLIVANTCNNLFNHSISTTNSPPPTKLRSTASDYKG